LKIKGLTSGSVVIKAPDTGAEDVEYDIANDFATPTSVSAVDTRVNAVGGRKNLIINGTMQVAQRGTSNSGTNVYATDRFKLSENTGGGCTVSQQSDGPHTTSGHLKYYTQVNVDTIDATLSGTEYTALSYKVEGYDFDRVNYGSVDAETMTLSFWHGHSEAGTYSISLRNASGGSNRNYVFDYTQTAGDVWERTSITIPGDVAGSWITGNLAAFSIMMTLANGTTYQTSTLNSWFTGTYYHSSTNAINMMATLNAKFRVTGVQLELGSVATEFEHRSYGEELALCQRYYEISGHMEGGAISSTVAYGRWVYKVEKRVAATVIKLTSSVYAEMPHRVGSTSAGGTWSTHGATTTKDSGVRVDGYAGFIAGQYLWINHSIFAFDAEL
jgi:hypothetical protein